MTKMTIEYIEARAGALGEITTFLNLGALFRHWQARRSVRHLASLDDYVLKDIGLSRAELFTVAGVPIDDVIAGRRAGLPDAFEATPSDRFSKGANDNARR